MGDVQQVILLLKVVILVGPPAVYFVVLGLLNSQGVPRLVNARNDFLALTAKVLEGAPDPNLHAKLPPERFEPIGTFQSGPGHKVWLYRIKGGPDDRP